MQRYPLGILYLRISAHWSSWLATQGSGCSGTLRNKKPNSSYGSKSCFLSPIHRFSYKVIHGICTFYFVGYILPQDRDIIVYFGYFLHLYFPICDLNQQHEMYAG